MCFIHIYDNFPFSSQISHFLQSQSQLMRMSKLHEVARRLQWVEHPQMLKSSTFSVPSVGATVHEQSWEEFITSVRCGLITHFQCRNDEAGKNTEEHASATWWWLQGTCGWKER